MRNVTLLCLVFLMGGGVANFAFAQPVCPGTQTVVNSMTALMSSRGTISKIPRNLWGFVGADGCTTMMFGTNPPDVCVGTRASAGSSFVAVVQIVFMMNPSKNTPANGCTFVCFHGNICQVRGGTALPVELMEFSIDEP